MVLICSGILSPRTRAIYDDRLTLHDVRRHSLSRRVGVFLYLYSLYEREMFHLTPGTHFYKQKTYLIGSNFARDMFTFQVPLN